MNNVGGLHVIKVKLHKKGERVAFKFFNKHVVNKHLTISEIISVSMI